MANEKRLIDANAFVEILQTDFKRVFTNAGQKVKPEDYYIKRKTVYNEDLFKAEVDEFCTMVDCFPTVDAVPVVHGEWLDGYAIHNGKEVYKSIDCSVCNEIFKVESHDREYWKNRFKNCPFCGSQMDGGNDCDI